MAIRQKGLTLRQKCLIDHYYGIVVAESIDANDTLPCSSQILMYVMLNDLLLVREIKVQTEKFFLH